MSSCSPSSTPSFSQRETSHGFQRETCQAMAHHTRQNAESDFQAGLADARVNQKRAESFAREHPLARNIAAKGSTTGGGLTEFEQKGILEVYSDCQLQRDDNKQQSYFSSLINITVPDPATDIPVGSCWLIIDNLPIAMSDKTKHTKRITVICPRIEVTSCWPARSP